MLSAQINVCALQAVVRRSAQAMEVLLSLLRTMQAGGGG